MRKLQLDDPSLQPDHCGVRSIIGAQFRKNAFDPAFDGFLRDRKVICNLLVGVPGCNQSQHQDFCRGQGVIGCMFGNFV